MAENQRTITRVKIPEHAGIACVTKIVPIVEEIHRATLHEKHCAVAVWPRFVVRLAAALKTVRSG